MRILRLAAKAGLLGYSLGALLADRRPRSRRSRQLPISQQINAVPHENPDQEIDNPAVPAIPAHPDCGYRDDGARFRRRAFRYDNLFSQKLPVELRLSFGRGTTMTTFSYQPKKTVRLHHGRHIAHCIMLTLGQEIKLNHQLNQETLDDLTDCGQPQLFPVHLQADPAALRQELEASTTSMNTPT